MDMLRLIMLSLFFALFAACDNGDGSGITSAEDNRQYSFEVFLESRIIPGSAILSIYSENHLLENTVKTIKIVSTAPNACLKPHHLNMATTPRLRYLRTP